jgi:biotin carboxylase
VSSRRLLLVGGSQVPGLARAARRHGLEPILLLDEDELCSVGGTDDGQGGVDVQRFHSAALRRILDLHEAHPLAGIVPVLQYGLAPAALALRRLGLPGPSPAAVERTANKVRMRQVLERAGLGQVRFAACGSPEEAEAFRRAVGGPIIVKPADGTGSEGVSRVNGAEELRPAFERADSGGAARGVLCEEFISGPEVSLEGYVVGGRVVPVAVTDKLSDARFLELGHTQPSRHPSEVQEAAWAVTERALAALGVDGALCHAEVRLSARGPVIVEIHPRIGGDHIPVLTALTTGVDLADVAVALALGEVPTARPRPTGVASAVAYLPPRAGTVRTVAMPPLESGTGVQRAGPGLLVKVGARLRGRSASWDRLAYAITAGPTAEAALEAARAHLGSMRIEFEEQQTPAVASDRVFARAE